MINAVLKPQTNQHHVLVYITAMLCSLFLSAYIDFREVLINPDAICYLSSAEAMGRLGLKNAMQLCGQARWPFYPWLIYHFVQVTHFSYMAAAYVIDGFFTLISVGTFVLIVKELGGSQRTLWIAALVILLAHEFNSVREYIVRDHGFWAFYLVSLFFLLRFFRKPNWLSAFSWVSSLLLATLFRIEGAFFLLMLPFTSFIFVEKRLRTRINWLFMLNGFLIVVGLVACCWLLYHPMKTMTVGRASEITQQIQHGLGLMYERYLLTKTALATHVLNTDSAKEAGLVLPIVLIAWYLISVIQNLSWIYAFLVVYAWRRTRQLFSTTARRVVFSYLFVNVLVTFAFLLEHMFFSKRYLIALSLILMLWVPFALDEMIAQKKRVLMVFVSLFIAISAAGGIFEFGYSKAYIANAGSWLADNVPKDAYLYANDYQLMYYSRHFGDSIFEKTSAYSQLNTIADGKWKQYDYLALRLSKKDDAATASIVTQIKSVPLQVFSNKRGDKVVIYKLRDVMPAKAGI